MDRETFANPCKDEDVIAIVVGDGSFGPHFDKEESIRLANFLSVEHEARVKLAVKKAVEEFRERAAKICADHYFDSLVGKGHGDALASIICALPTGPEGL